MTSSGLCGTATIGPRHSQSFITDLRKKSPGLASMSDANLVMLGKEFCAKLRAGVPALQVMRGSVAAISAKYMSGQITDSQQKILAEGLADIDEKASLHYCPEQWSQVGLAFAQLASGN
ncbi:MAG: hypothetical protein NVS3B6_21470 [Pseudarthrobacter sp.]